MPGITANLTPQAFVIWESIPKKERKPSNGMGGPRKKGRSAWLSSVLIEHAGWEERYKAVLDDSLARKEMLRIALKTIDKLQIKVQEYAK